MDDSLKLARKGLGIRLRKSYTGTFQIIINNSMKIRELLETDASTTSTANIGTVENPHISPGTARGKTSYIGSPGKSGTKAPPQPKVKQKKNKDGTAVSALDQDTSLFGGGNAIKR